MPNDTKFTSMSELFSMVRTFWLRYKAAPVRWSRPVLGVAVKTKRDVQKEFANELEMYSTLAKGDGNKAVVDKIANFAAGSLGEDGDDGTDTFKKLAKNEGEGE